MVPLIYIQGRTWLALTFQGKPPSLILFSFSPALLIGNDSNLLIVFYVQIMPDDFVMQLHRF
ncbi:hypothetical protein BCD20_13445 [Escherichia coli]|nr:hypothetical protein BCD20_13445 [Escherichia coli]